ncbi:LysR substrate-binding domain-containing protein [uncultured Psychrobacter sp.]|uniref:LysR substrate-binding domain-containing protein n=1 Tax=uncultured Psychrobacter sp. TaxID=259303 RepID=UPI003459A5EB
MKTALKNLLYDKTHDVWEFTRGQQTYQVKMNGNRVSNDGDLVKRWCIEGKGLAVKTCLDFSNDILAGRLIHIMTEYQAKQNELWLICPSRQSITPAVRLLRDTLREKCTELISRLTL